MALKLECGYLKGFIGEHEYAAMASQVENAHALLASGKGPGNDFLGWVDLPTNYDKEEFARIKAAAERIKKTRMCLSSSASAAPTSVHAQQSSSSRAKALQCTEERYAGHLFHRQQYFFHRAGGVG